MSILVEAVTLVIRRMTLDTAYPGGAEGWICRHEAGGTGARYVSADRHLVGVSLLNEAAEAEIRHLLEKGLVFVDDDAFQDLAAVSQERGLSWPCDWLQWSATEGECWSTCWMAGTEPGKLAVPEGWTPGQERLVASDVRLRPGMMRLSSEPGKEHWLDTRTGIITTHGTHDGHPSTGPMLERLRSWMEERGIDYSVSADGIVVGSVVLGQLSSRLWAHAPEEPRMLVVSGVLPLHVPEYLEEPLLEALSEWRRCEVDSVTRNLEARLVIEVEDGWDGPTVEFMEDVMAHLDRMARAAREVWTRLVADEPGDWGVHEVMALELPVLPDVEVSYAAGCEGEGVVLVPTLEHAEWLVGEAPSCDESAWYLSVTGVEPTDGGGSLTRRSEGAEVHWVTPLEDATRSVRAAVAGNPSLPEEVRGRMARRDFASIAEVARAPIAGRDARDVARPATNEGEAAPPEGAPVPPGALPDFEAMVSDPREGARIEAASHPGAPAHVLGELATDRSWRVRRAVARNPSTPPELLYRLVERGTPTILEAIAARGNLPATFVDFLLALRREEVVPGLLQEQARLSDRHLRTILDWGDRYAIERLCRRGDLPPWFLHHLARMDSPPQGLERHPSLSPGLLRLLALRLAREGEYRRLVAIAANRSTPADVLRALARLGAPAQGVEA